MFPVEITEAEVPMVMLEDTNGGYPSVWLITLLPREINISSLQCGSVWRHFTIVLVVLGDLQAVCKYSKHSSEVTILP